jgi:hypothetical protein
MDGFLGADAFGGYVASETSVRRLPAVGQAQFNGVVAFTNWPRGEVEAILPAGLELAANEVAPAWHPVAVICGEQTEGAVIMAGFTVPTGIRYHEFGIGVPFVRHGGDRALHIYIPRMYSSYFPAVWNGNAHYGFAKKLARMVQSGTDLAAFDEDETPLVRAEIEPAGEWLPGARCPLANFERMRAVFAFPVIGRRADGRYVCSRFDWAFNGALVRRVEAYISIDALLAPGLTPRRCRSATEGAFEVSGMRWRLTWPAPCRF